MKSIIEYKGKIEWITLPYHLELISRARKELGENDITSGVWRDLHEELKSFYKKQSCLIFNVHPQTIDEGEFFIPDDEVGTLDHVYFDDFSLPF